MSVLSDTRFIVRSLRRRPAFTASVVVILALGIGANSAVFSVVDAVLLRPVAVRAPDDVVSVYQTERGTPYGQSSFETYQQVRRQARTLSAVAATFPTTVSVTLRDASHPPIDLRVALASTNYFAVLGVSAAIGRTFLPSDPDAPGTNAVVVLSHALWTSQFGGDPAVVGTTIRVDEQLLTVIGVAPETFRGTSLTSIADVWIPISMIPRLPLGLLSRVDILGANSGVRIFQLIGRLTPGHSVAAVASELNKLLGTNTEAARVSVLPIAHGAAAVGDRDALVRFLRLLFGVVALTLILACVNIANLLLVRGDDRAHELGIRTALGADGRHLARQLLTESALLSVAGAVAGLAVAAAMTRLLSAFTLPGGIAMGTLDLRVDARILAFTGTLAVFTSLIFGAYPALRATRLDVLDIIRPRVGRPPTRLGRSAMLAVQVAVSLMLLVGAGLFLRSLREGFRTNLGFDARSVAAVNVQPALSGRHADKVQQYAALVAGATSQPDILWAAAGSHVPLAPFRRLPFHEGPATPASPPPDGNTVMAGLASVTPDYFKVLGIPLVAGRPFGDHDVATGTRVAIVNEAAARAFWAGADAVGRHFNFFNDRSYTVVGVVRDMKYETLQDQAIPFVYAPLSQEETRGVLVFLVRSARPVVALAQLERHLGSAAPTMTRVWPRLVIDQIATLLMPQRFGATLLTSFAVLALCVSALGIYGAVSYVVARRTSEIGIRMALGAPRGDVLRLVLRDCVSAVAVGVVFGAIGAGLAARLISRFLYGVAPSDWFAFVGAVLALMIVTIGAVLAPGIRAVRVDPVSAIRTH